MTVLVTGVVETGLGRKDSRDWLAWSPVVREGPDGQVITTRKDYPVRVVAGIFTAQMHPGIAVIQDPDGKKYTVTVLDEDCDLWELIATAVAFPPETSAEALAAAVTTFLDENPVTTMQVEGLTDAGTPGKNALLAETQAEAQTALGGSTSGKTVFSGTAAQGRTALGATEVGDDLFTAADAAAGRTALSAATRTEIYYAKDYGVVADGTTNNASALNSLITTVSNAGGGVVLLPIGTMVTNSVISMKSNVILRGHGWESILKLGANINGFGVVNIDGVHNVGVESLKIDGNSSLFTQVNSGIQGGATTGIPTAYSDVLIRDVWVDSPAYSGIMFLGSSTRAVEVKNIRVQDCKVTNAGGHGILGQWGVDQCWFERNTVIGHAMLTPHCLGICNGRFAYDTAMNDNYVDSTGASGNTASAISIDTPYARFTCHGNTVVNAVGAGIEVAMGVNGSVTGNHITGGAGAGIIFSGNEAGYPGVANLGVTVANNVIDGSVRGINFHMGESTANQAIPGSRTILRATAYTAATTTRAVEGRRLYECTTSGTSHATVKPAGWGTTNTGDTVTDGTSVWTDRGATHAQLSIAGNVIRNIVGVGIEMRYAHGVSITSNVITACTQSGIYADATANMYSIVGNDIYGNNTSADSSHNGIRIVGHSTASKVAKIGPNRVRDNLAFQDIVAIDSVSGSRLDNRIPAGTTQASVAYGHSFYTQNTGSTTITAFIDPNDIDGRVITVRINDAFTTLQHSASGSNTMRLRGGVNYSPPSGTVMSFAWSGQLAQWLEVSRTTADGSMRAESIEVGNASDTTVTRSAAGRIAVEGNVVAHVLSATAALDFGSVSAQAFADLTITVTGAATGDCVSLGVPTAAVTAGIVYSAWVSAADTVTVRAHNYTAGALDPTSGTFKAAILR